MAIEIKTSPGANLLSQAIGSLPQYVQMGQDRKTQELQNAISLMGAIQQKQVFDQEQDTYRKSNFMDAFGYENPQVMQWLQGLKYQPGKFVADATNESGFTWTGAQNLPDVDMAWEHYKGLVGGHPNQQDYDYFHTKLWPEVMTSRHQSISKIIHNLEQQGHDKRDIRWIMANNPMFDRQASALYNASEAYLPGTESAKYGDYMPGKDKSLTERWQEGAPWIGAGAIGAGYGYEYLNRIDEELKTDLQTKYDLEETKYKSKVDEAKDAVKKAKKIKAKTKKSKAAKKTRIDNLEKKVRSATSKKSTELKKLKTSMADELAESTKWRKWNLGSPIARTGAAMAAPWLMRKTGQMLGGDAGEVAGAFAGAGLEGTATAMSGADVYKKIAKMFAKNTAKRGAAGLGMAASDAMLPIGDIAALGMLGYGTVQDTIEAWRMYQEYQKRKNR